MHACLGKHPYETRAAAQGAAAAMGYGLRPYRCGDHWHIGHRSKLDRVAYGQNGIVPDADWELLRQLHDEAKEKNL